MHFHYMTYDLSDSDDLKRFLKSVEANKPSGKGGGDTKIIKICSP